MKRLVVLVAMLLSLSPVPTLAANQVYQGTIKQLYVDPVDIVFRLTAATTCGNDYYLLKRSNDNFNELYSLLLAASLSGKVVRIEVKSCEPARAVVSHGSVLLQ